MADIKNFIPFFLKKEGGFTNDPTDRGGATNKGVTIATYEAYCKKKGLPRPSVADLKHISDAHWYDIIKTMFWDKWRAMTSIPKRLRTSLLIGLWHPASTASRNRKHCLALSRMVSLATKPCRRSTLLTPTNFLKPYSKNA